MKPRLKLVEPDIARDCIEGLVRCCVQRRMMLRRDLAAEDARLCYLKRRLANQRGVAFIRAESLEREFGAA